MDEIVIVEYNPNWPLLFEKEATRLREILDGVIVSIKHFGSTAVPGLASKPIIDMLVGVRSLAEAKQGAVPRLESVGYSYWCDNPDPNRLFFVKGLPLTVTHPSYTHG